MMIVGLTAGTTTDSTAVGLTTTLNTNANLSMAKDTISILVPGIYEVIGSATVTSTAAGDTGLAVYVDGASDASSIFDATGTGDNDTITLYDVIDVTHATSGYVAVTILPVNAPSIVSGSVSVKRIS